MPQQSILSCYKDVFRKIGTVLAVAFLSLIFFLSSAFAQITPTANEKQVGQTGCTNASSSVDYDTLVQCSSTNATAGTMQKAPIFVGSVTAPPYASTTCDSAKAGMLQYTGDTLKGCDGTSWKSVGMSGTGTGSSAFSFTNLTGTLLDTKIISNAIVPSGFTGGLPVVCGPGCVDIYINGVSKGTQTLITYGNTLAIAQMSSNKVNTMTNSIVNIGSTVSTTWSVTTSGTDPCAATTPANGTICEDGSIYVGKTYYLASKMYMTRCDYGMIWDGSNCVGYRQTVEWQNTGSSGSASGVTSTTLGRANTTTLSASADANIPYFPAKACDDLVIHGRNDWYLPASLEGARIASYAGATAAGVESAYRSSFQSGNYSASNEYDATTAQLYRIPEGTTGSLLKSSRLYVRCVRM